MSNFQTLELRVTDAGIAWLWLNRPEKHNALNPQMIAELTEAAAMLGKDARVRAIVLGARGKSFCAGGDLEWMREQIDNPPEKRAREAKALADMLKALDTMPKPLVARIQGQAFGGGLGMISVCDSAIAIPGCRFALTETKLGLIPATIGPFVVRRLGEGHARRAFLTGRPFDSQEAMRIGLISALADADDLDEAVAREAGFALECAPGAVARAKALCLDLARTTHADEADYTAQKLAEAWQDPEAKAGISSFFARTPPPWKRQT